MSRTAEPAVDGGASVARVVAAAGRLGLDVAVVRLDASARTAADAARACGCPVGAIVKSIVFRAAGSDRHVLFLTGGDGRVDPARASALAGAPLEKADAAGVRASTGFAIGGVAPIGHVAAIDAWLDRALLRHDVIWAAAGSPHHVFAVAPDRLREATGAAVADFADR